MSSTVASPRSLSRRPSQASSCTPSSRGASANALMTPARGSRYWSGVGPVQVTSEYPAAALAAVSRSAAILPAGSFLRSRIRRTSACPAVASDPGGERRTGRFVACIAGQHHPPGRRGPPRGVPQQFAASSLPPVVRVDHDVQQRAVRVFQVWQREPVPGDDAAPGSGHEPHLAGITAVAALQPAAENPRGLRRPQRIVRDLRGLSYLKASPEGVRVRRVPSHDAHPSSQPHPPPRRERIFRPFAVCPVRRA